MELSEVRKAWQYGWAAGPASRCMARSACSADSARWT